MTIETPKTFDRHATRVESLCRMALACPMYAEDRHLSLMDVRIDGTTYRLLVPGLPGEFFLDGLATRTIDDCIALHEMVTHVSPAFRGPTDSSHVIPRYPRRRLRRRRLREYLAQH